VRDIHEIRVLVVEDDPTLREQLHDLLSREGYRHIRTVGTVSDALLITTTWQPQALILDVMLPDGNGFDLLRRIREMSAVPALFLSARDEDESRLRVWARGRRLCNQTIFALRAFVRLQRATT
jgi:DNA-binding response OmpR family regulator